MKMRRPCVCGKERTGSKNVVWCRICRCERDWLRKTLYDRKRKGAFLGRFRLREPRGVAVLGHTGRGLRWRKHGGAL
jgi:hypothetical protein